MRHLWHRMSPKLKRIRRFLAWVLRDITLQCTMTVCEIFFSTTSVEDLCLMALANKRRVTSSCRMSRLQSPQRVQ